MTTANTVVKKANSFIGTKEHPANSNNVIFNTDYYGHKVYGSAYPWCVVFIWDVFRMCKASKLFYNGKKTASCDTVYSWGKKDGLIVKTGKKGDLVIFDWQKNGHLDHIGIIEKKTATGYQTIEGNTSTSNNSNGGEVMRRNRKKSDVFAIIRPKYSKEKITAKKKKSNKAIAKEVIAGKWGTGDARKKKLEKAGYNYIEIQKAVNDLVKPKVVVKGKTTVDLNVRKGAGLNYPYIKTLKKGTTVKCQAVKIDKHNNTWWKINTGEWACAKYNGKVYIKHPV